MTHALGSYEQDLERHRTHESCLCELVTAAVEQDEPTRRADWKPVSHSEVPPLGKICIRGPWIWQPPSATYSEPCVLCAFMNGPGMSAIIADWALQAAFV